MHHITVGWARERRSHALMSITFSTLEGVLHVPGTDFMSPQIVIQVGAAPSGRVVEGLPRP
jgi:hypothetical protein